MADDSLPTLWKADPHTAAKLDILKAYLQAWMPILSHQAAKSGSRVVYVDAFAGPGEYINKEHGSPLAAVDAARNHLQNFPVPIRMFFIEKREDRWRHLEQLMEPLIARAQKNCVIEAPIYGAADEQVRLILKKFHCPTLVFLDQFGYSAVPMNLIKTIMTEPSREVFSFMNWRDLNRYIPDSTKWPGIDKAFGGQEWREILGLGMNHQRSRRFLELYDEALKIRGNVRYSCSFSMHDQNDQLLYWLVFCSNNDRGLEEMKKSMWHVDATGQFRFSDRYSEQLMLLPGFDQGWLANMLRSTLLGQEMSVGDVRHFVLTKTPRYLYADALKTLEQDGSLKVVKAPPQRRKGSFAKYEDDPDFIVRFQQPKSFQQPESQGTLF